MIRVLVPDMPTAEELMPYLRRIDEARQYTNGGPLVRELEQRLGGICVSSCTLGLELAARCQYGPGSTVRVPAFTFAATALSVLRAGLAIRFCDVDPETWVMPNTDAPCLPVCTFGAPAQGALVDAAGAFGNAVNAKTAVFSLHATKTLGAGEGGLVMGNLAEEVRRLSNFGFDNGMVSMLGTNAKMSEYHAAVALASLEIFQVQRRRREQLEARYRANLAGLVGMQKRPPGCYAIFPVLVDHAQKVAERLLRHGIETRRWYVPSLERHPRFQYFHRDPLPVTDMLNERLLCLPFHVNLTDTEIDFVCEILTEKPNRGRMSTSSQTWSETESSSVEALESMHS